VVTGLNPGGNTGIGDALDASAAEFNRVATIGRSRTAYLMTDGFNTSGVDPVAAANRLRDIGVRVHVIPAGSEVSQQQLGGVASATGGQLFPAPTINELTSVYAELAARHGSAGIALPRTNFELSLRGGLSGVHGENQSTEGKKGKFPPRERAFPIAVEKNAKALVGFVSGRNSRMADWAMSIELRGPNGEVFGPGSPELTVNSHYLFIRVPNPSAGDWKLVAKADGPILQQATAFAYIVNPDPSFFADVKPRVIQGAGTVKISANPAYVIRLSGEDVTVTGQVKGPGGLVAPVTFAQNSTGAWEGETSASVNGTYTITLRMNAGNTATLAPGESIFDGPDVPPLDVFPFKRYAAASFAVVDGKDGDACNDLRGIDCDLDGVSDKEECPKYPTDIDGDGLPNTRDPDADGDEIPDAVEGMKDSDQNGEPDMCEKSKPRTAPPPIKEGRLNDDCMPLRTKLIKVSLIGKDWRLTDDNLSLFEFGPDQKAAELALRLLEKYEITELCSVGRPRPTFNYLLSNGNAPKGSIDGENCTEIDPLAVVVAESDKGFELQFKRKTLYSFAEKSEAEVAMQIIRARGFSYACQLGGPPQGMTYLRK
jgi:hypothetical protein